MQFTHITSFLPILNFRLTTVHTSLTAGPTITAGCRPWARLPTPGPTITAGCRPWARLPTSGTAGPAITAGCRPRARPSYPCTAGPAITGVCRSPEINQVSALLPWPLHAPRDPTLHTCQIFLPSRLKHFWPASQAPHDPARYTHQTAHLKTSYYSESEGFTSRRISRQQSVSSLVLQQHYCSHHAAEMSINSPLMTSINLGLSQILMICNVNAIDREILGNCFASSVMDWS